MEYEQICYDVADNILTITLNRPDKLNAYTVLMFKELMAAFDKADADDDIRVIVITGSGRAFCAGADLSTHGEQTFDYSFRPDRPRKPGIQRDSGGILALRIYALNKPIIAAINGPAVGVGLTMTLPMDIRLASNTAKFGFVFARRGIAMESCGSWFLPRIVGISQALEWAHTGRVFLAEEAKNTNLVLAVHSADELLTAAYAIGKEIVNNTAAVSVAMSRHLLWRTSAASHPMHAHEIESLTINALGKSNDAKEGIKSFLKKRPPEFSDSTNLDMPDFYPWWDEPDFNPPK